MQLLPISQLKIPERQRTDIAPRHISDLKKSILEKGLLHPPVLRADGETLLVGECRSRAIKELCEDGLIFKCNGQIIPQGMLPFLLVADLTPDMLAEAELEENILRASLTWPEESEARVLVHRLRLKQNPAQTLVATSKELADKSGRSSEAERQNLQRALAVAPHLTNPRVKAAKSLREAHRVVLDLENASFKAELVRRGGYSGPHTVLLGDCRELLKTLPEASFDLVITDPPYGIKADKMKKTAKHFYEDDPETALEINKAIIRESFRLLKPRGLVILFCDPIEHVRELREFAKAQAFTPFRTPLIWIKGEDEDELAHGHAPWGSLGFARTYEGFIFLSKGGKGTKEATSDVKVFKRPARGDRVHAAEKPIDLLIHLLSITCDIGDRILDPTCGSGPIFEAATTCRLQATGIEIDPEYHALACGRLTDSEAEAPTKISELLS